MASRAVLEHESPAAGGWHSPYWRSTCGLHVAQLVTAAAGQAPGDAGPSPAASPGHCPSSLLRAVLACPLEASSAMVSRATDLWSHGREESMAAAHDLPTEIIPAIGRAPATAPGPGPDGRAEKITRPHRYMTVGGIRAPWTTHWLILISPTSLTPAWPAHWSSLPGASRTGFSTGGSTTVPGNGWRPGSSPWRSWRWTSGSSAGWSYSPGTRTWGAGSGSQMCTRPRQMATFSSGPAWHSAQ